MTDRADNAPVTSLWHRFIAAARDVLSLLPPSPMSNAGDHLEFVLYLFYFSVLVTSIISIGFLHKIPQGTSFSTWVVMTTAMISNAFFLNFVLLLVLTPATVAARVRVVTCFILPVLFVLLNFALYVDWVVFSLYKSHFNGMVFSVMFAPHADEIYHVGTWTYISGIMVGLLILLLFAFFTLAVFRYVRRLDFFARMRSRKGALLAAALIFLFPAVDKTVYAWADITDRTLYMRGKTLFPLYQAVTAKRWARKWLKVQVRPESSLTVDTASSALNYPKAPIIFQADIRKPNVIIIALESVRGDMLAPDISPFLYRWGTEHIVGERHYTSGNRSTHGVFGMMYGINSTYWYSFLSERRGPVLVSELRKLGYSFKILSSSSTTFAECPKTSFVEIREAVDDRWHKAQEAHERDRVITDKFIAFLDSAPTPFFSFLWYDGPHQPYRYSPEHEVFPVRMGPDDINYVRLATDDSQGEEMFKRYKNSIHCLDAQLERLLTAVKERGLMDNTLIFIAGDHGEEFGEFGSFGHGNAFSPAQTNTLFVAHVPGVEHHNIRHLTSHVDFVPTILDYIGVANPPSDYSHGCPITAPEGPSYVVVGGWDSASVIDGSSIIVFGLEGFNADTTVFDMRFIPLPNQSREIRARTPVFMKVLQGLTDFVK
ncbi:MAG: sulfatase-like hydrolase/transferase [Planctomycetes bacterium]|nr:sulfatase-like hydrolase/transferase [Planctomycetota bacterium]